MKRPANDQTSTPVIGQVFLGWLAALFLVVLTSFSSLLLPTSAFAEVGYVVRFSSSESRGTAPLTVRYNLLAETRPRGKIARVEIDPGDGSGVIVAHTGRGWIRPNPRHNYTRPGRFTARMTMTTEDGQRVTSQARVTVMPETPADPAELLQVDDNRGDAPHTATFQIGGDSLPFTARAARLNFGDGEIVRVLPFQTISHTYSRPGRYLARLEIRGNDGNRARAARMVTVDDAPRLRFTVAPTSGVAPVEVTVRANVPGGDVRRAGVLQDGQEIIGTGELVGQNEGRRKITFTEPGTYHFELRAITENGERYRERQTVVVRKEDLADGETYYEHDGGVVQIIQQGGAFEGIMRAPTVDQALAGYDIGDVFVRGTFADRSYSAMRPLNYDDPNSERRRYYEDHAVQVAGGSYHVRFPQCPPQWGEYGFNITFGDEENQATTISGTVVYKDFVTRAELAFSRAGEPMPRAGITGRIRWVAEMIAMMRRYGDNSGRPDECVTEDAPDTTRPAVFTRISRERAQELARQNVNNIRNFAERAYDGFDGPPPDDGTPRMTDPTYGDPPSSEDPVYLASGEFYETSVDLRAPAPLGLGWRFQRTYRSQSPVHTSMGHGWVHNYQLALVRDDDGWRLRDENGGHEYFRPTEEALFQSADGARLKISAEDRVIRTRDGMIYTFVPETGLEDQSRLEHVVASGGARLDFDYDLQGRLVRVVDGNGAEARYTYDGDRGYLVRVDAPDGTAVGFAHDQDGNLYSKYDLNTETGTALNETRYVYRGGGEETPQELHHNMTQVWLAWGIDQQPSLEIQYGEEPDGTSFDRVVWQRTGTLIEKFEYGRQTTNGAELFTTRLNAEGRAEELHLFARDGRHEATTYIMPDAENIMTDLLYDASGKPAGRIYASGASFTTTAGPAANLTIETRTPEPGSDQQPVHWVVETEPVFGQQKAFFGPFIGAIPSDMAEIEAKRRITRIFDYEEAGAGASAALRAFGISAGNQPLGDVNQDGLTDQSLGRMIQETRADDAGVTSHVWTESGARAETRRPDGSMTRYTYSDQGYLAQVTEIDAQGRQTTAALYDWDNNGGLIGAEVGDGSYIGIERDALGRMVRVTQAGRPDRSFEYDAFDRIIAEHRDDHKAAEFVYDGFGRLVETRRWADAGEPIVESYTFDAFGRAIGATDPTGNWSREIDLLGRTVREVMPDGEERRFAYDVEGRLISESGLGWSHAHRYDGFGRRIETATQTGDVIRVLYDDEGRPATRTVLNNGTVVQEITLQRGQDGDLSAIAVGLSDTEKVVLPGGDRTVSVGLRSAALYPVSTERDLMGRVLGFESNDGSIWQTSLDAADRLTEVSRNGKNVFSVVYQPDEQQTVVRMYGFASQQFRRDGLVETRTDGRGAQTVSTRDGYGRLLSEIATFDAQSAERTYAYDGVDRMIFHSRDETTWSRRYEGAAPIEDRLNIAAGDSYSINRRFDDQGRLVERVLPSGTASAFSYPDDSTVVVAIGGDTITLVYTAEGAISSVTLGDTEVQYMLPIAGAPDSAFHVTAKGGGQTLLDRRIRFENGRAAAIDEPLFGDPQKIERNEAGRITSVSQSGLGDSGPPELRKEEFNFDEAGARLSAGQSSPWLPTHAEDASLATLDPDGRVTELNNRTIVRDPFGLVSTVEWNGTTTKLLRDGQGRVVALRGDGRADDIVYDGGTITGVYRNGEPAAEYILDPNNVPVARVSEAGLELLALDFGGGPLAYIGSDGKFGTRIFLSAFGTPEFLNEGVMRMPDIPQPQLDGMLFDPASGLYLTAIRAMDPEIGQFLSPEPFGPLASPLPYEYAAGDPFTFRDTTGAIPSGNGGIGADVEPTEGLFDSIAKIWDNVTSIFKDDVEDEIGRASDEDNSGNVDSNDQGGSGGSEPSTGSAGNNATENRREPVYTPSERRRERDLEREEEARDRRARIAEIEARQRAEESAFKRNSRFAHEILPEEVRNQWLDEEDVFLNGYNRLYDEDTAPWGEPATGPSVGNEGDPHALLRETLRQREGFRNRTSDRLRFLFREQISTPPSVAPPAAQLNPPPRPAPPGRQPSGISGFAGGSPRPSTAPAQPTPAERKGPGGMSRLGNLLR